MFIFCSHSLSVPTKCNYIPTILPNVAPYLSKRLPPERNARKRPEEVAVPPKRRRLSTADEPDVREWSPSSGSGVLNERQTNDDPLAAIATLRDVKLPNRYWTFHELQNVDGACFTSCSLNASTGEVKVEKAVFFTVNSDGGIHSRTFVQGKSVAEAAVVTMLDAEAVLNQASLLHLCKGVGTQAELLTDNITVNLQRQLELKSGSVFSVKCLGSTKKEGTPCFSCKYLRKALITRQSRIRKRHKASRACSSAVKKLKVCARKNKRLMVRLGNLAKDVRRLKEESAATAEEVLAAKINLLSPKQQLAIRQCFEAAKRKSTCGMLYDKEWMLECILLKIRSPKLYQYMRKQNILALPNTISSFLSIEENELKGKKKLMDTVNAYLNKQAPATESTLGNAAEHPYHVRRSDSRLTCHLAGYVAKKCILPGNCPDCIDYLLLPAQDGCRMPAAEFIKHNDLGASSLPPQASSEATEPQPQVAQPSQGPPSTTVTTSDSGRAGDRDGGDGGDSDGGVGGPTGPSELMTAERAERGEM
ncbi:hypothetical protein HPB50_027704 [Hyalomma asiaticum]|nr:hypothetical protein HPB50_027704 [Hyalomma asiaticum]